MKHDEQAIRNLIAKWHSATAAADVDAVLPLMAADVVFLTPGHPPMKGRDTFEKGLRAILQTHRIESTGDIQEIRISDDLAYCWTILNVRITPLSGGSANLRTGSTLSILRKQPSGDWQLVRDANLLVPEGGT